MLYVWLASWKPGLSQQQMDGALQRRASWRYPEGVRVLGEYWAASHAPCVISIFQADDYRPIMDVGFDWQDVFEIQCIPACTPEQGLQWGAEILAARAA